MITSQTLSTYSCATGGPICAPGTFYWDLHTGKWLWSEQLYRLHGYERGDIVPTLDLVMAHNHPEDRPRINALYTKARTNGAAFISYHRLIDAKQHEHRIFTAAEGLPDAAGTVYAIQGHMLDLTETLQKETEQAAREAVRGATANRATIEQAKGYLMGLFHIDPAAAFDLLLIHSQHTNTKLATLARELVDAASHCETSDAAEQLARTFLPRTPEAGPSLKHASGF